MESQFQSNQMIEAVKMALLELLAERKPEVMDALAEVLEDKAFGLAIEEGAKGSFVSKNKVFEALSDSSND